MITYINTFADLARADSGSTICISARVNPALPLCERYPEFQGTPALRSHLHAIRGGVSTSFCSRMLARSDRTVARLIARHA